MSASALWGGEWRMMGMPETADSGVLATSGLAIATCVHELTTISQLMRDRAKMMSQQLHVSIESYVTCLRAEGLPPEQVVILVKSAVKDALPYHLSSKEVRELMDDVVRWSIEAYFDR